MVWDAAMEAIYAPKQDVFVYIDSSGYFCVSRWTLEDGMNVIDPAINWEELQEEVSEDYIKRGWGESPYGCLLCPKTVAAKGRWGVTGAERNGTNQAQQVILSARRTGSQFFRCQAVYDLVRRFFQLSKRTRLMKIPL